MAFQVKEFDSIQTGSLIDWKFKLINKNASQFNFYDIEQNGRSLLDLVKDISGQIDIEIQNKRKKPQHKTRMIRKSCQKIIKALKLSLTSFAHDIDEDLQSVKAFFKKQKLQETTYLNIVEKCKKWAISTWLSLDSEDFFKTTQKYIQSYIKDGKKMNPDFEYFTELYGVVIGEQKKVPTQDQQIQGSKLIQVDINLLMQQKYISQSILYNPSNLSYIKCRSFSQLFIKDLLKEQKIKNLQKQKLQKLEQQVRIQIRSQCLYKTLLKKHSSTLLNFSTIEIPIEVKQYLVPIEIKLKDDSGTIVYEDYFQWDILSELNNVQKFCQQLIIDAELDPKYCSQLCYAIRTEINAQLQWKFTLLVKTFKQIHKQRQSPKLNTQTTQIIKKNLPYTMDVLMVPQNKSYKPSQSLIFSNSDIFSLLSRNIDILPQQFQAYLVEKEQKQTKQEHGMSQKNFGEEMTAASHKNNKNSTINILLGNEAYQKANLKIQNNPYLLGINKAQSSQIWKRLTLEEKISVQ